jgi:N6-L-threonylcarbamoyladenine synthase
MRLLAIETSCDETAAAIVTGDPLRDDGVTVECSVVASQIDLHQKYGGVYPEVASREHGKKIIPVLCEALGLKSADPSRLPDFKWHNIDAIAVTHGPGLIGSLLVGTQTAATIALATDTPLIAVNHLAGHIYASFIREEDARTPEFPLMALVVSGGHTMLIYMESHHHYQLLGQTRDDAAGEAFDKVAKLLGLPYPGGPHVSELARSGDREAYNFPIGLEHDGTLDFSFSGLKTAVLRAVTARPMLTDIAKADIAASFERAVVDALLLKTAKALDQFPVRHFVLGGGVAANSYLRERLTSYCAHRTPRIECHVPKRAWCTDNAAVIGAAAMYQTERVVAPTELVTYARLPLAT